MNEILEVFGLVFIKFIAWGVAMLLTGALLQSPAAMNDGATLIALGAIPFVIGEIAFRRRRRRWSKARRIST